MEWTCRECGCSVIASDETLPRAMGWIVSPPAEALCALCRRKWRDNAARRMRGHRPPPHDVSTCRSPLRPRP